MPGTRCLLPALVVEFADRAIAAVSAVAVVPAVIARPTIVSPRTIVPARTVVATVPVVAAAPIIAAVASTVPRLVPLRVGTPRIVARTAARAALLVRLITAAVGTTAVRALILTFTSSGFGFAPAIRGSAFAAVETPIIPTGARATPVTATTTRLSGAPGPAVRTIGPATAAVLVPAVIPSTGPFAVLETAGLAALAVVGTVRPIPAVAVAGRTLPAFTMVAALRATRSRATSLLTSIARAVSAGTGSATPVALLIGTGHRTS